jgi:RNase adaptor protein for sRNA GlmZ degradation
MCCVWQTSLDLLSQDKEERRRHKLQAFKQLAERLEDERKMMDYRRQQIEERKELQVCILIPNLNPTPQTSKARSA